MEGDCENQTVELALLVENAANALNHEARRCLFGKNACRTYFGSVRVSYNKRKRKVVYDCITDLAVDLKDVPLALDAAEHYTVSKRAALHSNDRPPVLGNSLDHSAVGDETQIIAVSR